MIEEQNLKNVHGRANMLLDRAYLLAGGATAEISCITPDQKVELMELLGKQIPNCMKNLCEMVNEYLTKQK